jgi:hypothetical protein
MTYLNKYFAPLIIGFMLIPNLATADVKKGKKVYKKKLHKKCKFPGSTFARKHTQDEWETLHEKGSFQAEAKKICPSLELSKLSDAQWENLYDFTYTFAIGGEIPNGCDPK